MTRRVVVTGLGTVNSLSSHVPDFWQALCAGRSGVGPIDLFDTTAFKTKFGGQVKNWEPEKAMDGKTARRLDRFAQFAMVSAIHAVKDCGIDFSREDTYRCGVIFASGIGGLSEFEDQHSAISTADRTRSAPS
jgi:3-oxoacyl-(acyl-carrier-protein) synthase